MNVCRKILENVYRLPSLSVEERRKRVFLSLCILACIPAAVIFSILDFYAGRWLEGSLVMVISLIFIVILFLFNYLSEMRGVYRISGTLVFIILVHELAVGGGDGYAFVWFYFYPIVLFFIFGKQEGLAWVSASFVTMAFFFFPGIGTHSYSHALSIRFLLSYLIVSIIAYALELSRDNHYQSLLDEKRALEDAMRQIKQLSGMLPICAHCKKIRDDNGYWNQIEAYLHEHAGADFSHGICPDCILKFYPDQRLYEDDEPAE